MEPATQLEQRLHQQEVVAELGKRALETDDLDQLMHDAVVAVAGTLDTAYAKVLELLPDGNRVVLKQGIGWRDGLVGSATVPTDLNSQAGYTLQSGEPVIVTDLRTETRFSSAELPTSHDVVSGISVIIGSVEEPWGVLGTHTTERREFTKFDAAFVQSVSNVLASAIERHGRERENDRLLDLLQHTERTADVGGWDLITSTNELTWTDQLYDILDVSTDFAPTLDNVFDAAHRADRDRVTAALDSAIQDGESIDVEARFFTMDGDIKWLHVRGVPEVEGEAVVRIRGAAQDITTRKEREQKLQQANQRTELALSATNATAWEWEPDSDAVRTHPDPHGLFESDIRTIQEFLEGVHRNDRHRVESALVEAMKTDSTFHVEYRYRRDGSVRWAEDYGERFDVPNRGACMLGVAYDITERKERQRALEESEQRYRTLIENFPNGVVGLVDEDIRYVTVGGSPAEVAGLSVEEVEENRVEEVLPDPLAEMLVPRYEAAFAGESSSFEGEYNGRVNRFHVIPVRDEDGDIFAALGMSQNITELKERQRALAASEGRYRTLAENFPNGAVALFDHDLRYTAAGGELLDDLGVEDIVGGRILQRYPRELLEEIEPHFWATFDGEEREFEVEYLNRNLLARTLPIRNATGKIDSGMLVVLDMTTARESQRRLEESHERLEEFASAVSHDLREPLGTVASYLQLLERQYDEELDEDAQEFIEFAVSGAIRMREMIDGLVTTYARVESGGEPFDSVDLHGLLDDVRQDLSEKIVASNARIRAESLPSVRGHRGQLEQVLMNLIDNAIKYSGTEPPEIHVAAKRDGVMWKISVSDKGIGIEREASERIFDVFTRVHAEDSSPGTGIGLAICDRIVERHDGEIWVESEPGEGSTFTFTVPTVQAAPADSE